MKGIKFEIVTPEIKKEFIEKMQKAYDKQAQDIKEAILNSPGLSAAYINHNIKDLNKDINSKNPNWDLHNRLYDSVMSAPTFAKKRLRGKNNV